ISQAELSAHASGPEIWIAYRGIVYNITCYLNKVSTDASIKVVQPPDAFLVLYQHPGGIKELMRGAGKDATQFIYDAHPWVNIERLLGEQTIMGVLERSNNPFLIVPRLFS
ncbi:hypothetical protein HDU93_004639, partial [Gonapodya sp. JEL0774]